MFAVLFLLGAVAGLSLWTSRVNSFFFFGRTVPAEFRGTADAKRITRRYLGCILISFGLLYARISRACTVELFMTGAPDAR